VTDALYRFECQHCGYDSDQAREEGDECPLLVPLGSYPCPRCAEAGRHSYMWLQRVRPPL
jgi:hypothetical protein